MEYTGYELLWLFLIYAFLGWCAEVSLAAIKRKRLIMKGFLNAPFCLIYGFGAVAFSVFLPELKEHIFFLFLGGMVIASFLEYTTGHFLERIFHKKWWDYSDKKYHAKGYICLEYSVIWGLCSILIVKYSNPLFLWFVHFIPLWLGILLISIVLLLLVLDAISVSTAILQMHHNLGRIAHVSEDWQKLADSLGNALTRKIQRRILRAYPNLTLEEFIKNARKPKEPKSLIFAEGCCFYKLTALFFIGAFLGDLVETIFCYATVGVWMSRSSVVYGPFSIVWGLGAVLLTAMLYQYREKGDRYIFISGTVLGGVYEYMCSVFTELVFGTIFWDYSAIPFNLGGRINLLYCFFWGIAAVIWLKIIYPVLSNWIESFSPKMGKLSCHLLIIFMSINIVISGMAMIRYSERANGIDRSGYLSTFFDEHFPDQRMDRIYPNAKIVK
ncbi:MAG: putative ABC transporter permease [Hungatella sp.]